MTADVSHDQVENAVPVFEHEIAVAPAEFAAKLEPDVQYPFVSPVLRNFTDTEATPAVASDEVPVTVASALLKLEFAGLVIATDGFVVSNVKELVALPVLEALSVAVAITS